MSVDQLSISRIGNRGARPTPSLPVQSSKQRIVDEFEAKAQRITRFVLEAMEEKSQFFSENPPFPLPQFESDQVALDQELGKGEFGKVSAIQAFHVEDNCSCPRCCKPSPECCTQEINGKQVALCCGAPVESGGENPAAEEQKGDCLEDSVSVSGTAPSGTTVTPDPLTSDRKDHMIEYIPVKAKPKLTSPQFSFDMGSGLNATEDSPQKHRRKDTAVSFAENVVSLKLPLEKQRDDDSTLSSGGDDDEIAMTSMPENLSEDAEILFWRGYMGSHIVRQGRPRYAMKRLREDLPQDKLLNAITDLAAEAKFMSSIRHPNICKMRGTVSQPGKRDFAIVMDYLLQPLSRRMDEWKEMDEKGSKFSMLERLLHQPRNKKDEQLAIQKERYADKLLAMFDAARALRYLHNHSIVFRDLKPENLAFDFRGDLRMFDFGLTGSRRYMAPEVILCKDYGLSADVYSFAIVVWEVMSNQPAYTKMNFEKHFEHAVEKKKRPNIKKMISNKQILPKDSIIHELVEKAWAPNPRERPNILKVCDRLSTEVLKTSQGGSIKVTDRTNWLANRSLKSRCESP
eukprot:scaffold8747_cov96-Cylindrotheca_fusiformis.AAC.9